MEFRLAVRSMRSSSVGPIVIVALAGAAFATAVSGALVRTVLLSPLPYPAPSRLAVVFSARSPGSTTGFTSSSWDDYEAHRDAATSFETLEAQLGFPFNLIGPDAAQEVGGLRVTPGYFGMLGAAPGLGRLFAADDYDPRAGAVVEWIDLLVAAVGVATLTLGAAAVRFARATAIPPTELLRR